MGLPHEAPHRLGDAQAPFSMNWKRHSCSVYQALLNGITCQLGVGAHVHLLEHAGAIGADGFYTERKLLRDLRDGPARGDAAHHLKLAVRQTLMRIALFFRLERIGERFSETSANVFFPGEDFSNLPPDLIGRV